MAKVDIAKLLAAADERNGFPAGTMAAVMQQETGGKRDYLEDPSKYHYGLNAEGRRVAGHTGKISTAFGPFGILESTGRDPGYGVSPLKDKSLEEQVRFASDYLAARTKHSGGDLRAGLAGYGEGDNYAAQVVGRLPGTQVKAAPVVTAKQVPALEKAPVAPQVATIPADTMAQVVALAQSEIPKNSVVATPAQGVEEPAMDPRLAMEWNKFARYVPTSSGNPWDMGEYGKAQTISNPVALNDAPVAIPQVNFSPFTAFRSRA